MRLRRAPPTVASVRIAATADTDLSGSIRRIRELLQEVPGMDLPADLVWQALPGSPRLRVCWSWS